MTSLLQKAFEVTSKLPALEQNILARTVLDEIESEKKWDDLFAESEDVLAQLATEALREEEQGTTTDVLRANHQRLQSGQILGGEKIVWFWAGTHADYDGLLRQMKKA